MGSKTSNVEPANTEDNAILFEYWTLKSVLNVAPMGLTIGHSQVPVQKNICKQESLGGSQCLRIIKEKNLAKHLWVTDR